MLMQAKGKFSSSSPAAAAAATKRGTTTSSRGRGKADKKVYSLPGQKFDPPEEREPLRIFYESLSKQIPSSEMAEFWYSYAFSFLPWSPPTHNLSSQARWMICVLLHLQPPMQCCSTQYLVNSYYPAKKYLS